MHNPGHVIDPKLQSKTTTDLQDKPPVGRRRHGRTVGALRWLSALNRRGNVAVMFAFLAPVMAIAIGGMIDVSSMVTAQMKLQDATDAAALAVSANTAKNPNMSETALQAIAQTVLTTDYNSSSGSVKMTEFHVCAAVQADCTTNAKTTLANETVYIATQAQAPCYLGALLPGLCTSGTNGNLSNPINISTTSTIGYAMNVQINLLLDSSASMIVGATTADVEAVENWNAVPANWNTVHYSGDNSQTTPCAFACHDEGPTTGNETKADIALGLSRASNAWPSGAGATTRFGVMISAAHDLINHIQTEVNNSHQLALNNYFFNISDVNDAITSDFSSAKTDPNDFTGAANAICSSSTFSASCSQVKIGIDTSINETLPNYATTLIASTVGTTSAPSLKFLIIVTDGLESDFKKDFYPCSNSTSNFTTDSAWGGYYCNNGAFAGPMSTAACTTLKNAGVVVAVLETPYVRLDKDPSVSSQNSSYFPQNPSENLYEYFVRHYIYPGGDGSVSMISSTLGCNSTTTPSCATTTNSANSCASSGYYFQATNSTQISTGFVALTDKFLATTERLSQ